MFRKISWDMILTYILVTIFSVVFLGTYLLGYLDRYFTDYMNNELLSQAYTIAENWPRRQDISGLSRQENNYYRGIITRLSNQTGSRIVILDSNGVPLWHWPRSTAPDYGISILPEVRSALKGEPAGGNHTEFFSQAYPIKEIITANTAPEVIGVVYVTRSKTYLQSIIIEIRNRFIKGFLISVTLALILGIIFSHTLTKPIVEITRAAERMAGGDLKQRANVSTRNEIGVLSRKFNLMAERLQGTLEDLMGEKNKLSAIIDHMAGGVLVVDTAGKVIMTNSKALQLLGIRSGEVLGQKLSKLIPGHSLLVLLEDTGYLKPVRAPLEEHTDDRFIDAHITPLFTGTEKSIGAVVILNDVTEFRLLDKLRSEFVSNVSHELKTPLASIKGLTELLIDGALQEERAGEFLESINREVDRLVRLVRDLLDLSKMESGMVSMERQSVDMSRIIPDVLRQMSFQAEKKRIEMTSELNCEKLALANRDRIKQVLINLIDNALRYTPEGEKIFIRLKEDGGRCLVEVEDTGPGISPEDMERVFERFYRTDRARARDAGGFGLGLAICRQIIENLGGNLGVNSNPPKGTTFYFTLNFAGPSNDTMLQDY